jgi:hypothetical protein
MAQRCPVVAGQVRETPSATRLNLLGSPRKASESL